MLGRRQFVEKHKNFYTSLISVKAKSYLSFSKCFFFQVKIPMHKSKIIQTSTLSLFSTTNPLFSKLLLTLQPSVPPQLKHVSYSLNCCWLFMCCSLKQPSNLLFID